MKACDILKKNGTHSIEKNLFVKDAIKLMADFKIGSLLILENERLVGIITERDILNICSKCTSKVRCATRIEDVFTKKVICGTLDDDIMHIMEIMKERHIRHLPIVTGDKIEGMISMRDLLDTLLDETTFENQRLMEYVSGKYPA